MQTFLPYADYKKSAQSLDNRRLNKQALECYQLIRSLVLWKFINDNKLNPNRLVYARDENNKPIKTERIKFLKMTGWKNHPARQMWVGYEKHLVYYALIICQECKQRGIKNTLCMKIADLGCNFKDTGKPNWLGNQDFHNSHKSNLIRKDNTDGTNYYKSQWPNMTGDLPYIWPNQLPKTQIIKTTSIKTKKSKKVEKVFLKTIPAWLK